MESNCEWQIKQSYIPRGSDDMEAGLLETGLAQW